MVQMNEVVVALHYSKLMGRLNRNSDEYLQVMRKLDSMCIRKVEVFGVNSLS
jgi:hypothetical protein